ncbi:glutamate--cysteine ligase, partial [Klebsiella pneumoniae]
MCDGYILQGTHRPGETMPLADFHRSDPFTLGIELELQVVNPPGY